MKLCEPHGCSDSDDDGRPPFLAQSEDLRHISDPSLDIAFDSSGSPGSVLSISGKGLRGLMARYFESLTTRRTQVESLVDELREMQRPLAALQVLRKQEQAFLETDSLLTQARGSFAQQMLSALTSMLAQQQHDSAESMTSLLQQIARRQEHNSTAQSHRNMPAIRLGLLQKLAQRSGSIDAEVDQACGYLENLLLKLVKELTEDGFFMLPGQKGKENLHV
ncbi:hypothetical protein ANO14919_145580 [Xylariales sp. No.14919]|nr:hypothetical protein ANO14919_145580 [Xylariales sp. No.14919]